MTSDEIQKMDQTFDAAELAQIYFLKEIAYQLAVMNEKQAEREAEKRYVQGFENGQKLAQRLGSTVPPDSEPTLRGKWRVGSKVKLNVYDGDRPVCQCHSFIDAQDIVNAMNATKRAMEQHPKS